MISVAVMAHRSREALVLDLVGSIDADVTVAWDERANEWDTGRRALDAYDRTARWHVVLQDDAVVCRDLVAGLDRALEHVPSNAAVGLYIGRPRNERDRIGRITARADDEACSWIHLPQLHWGVGLVVPVVAVDEILRVGDRTRVLEYDRRLSTVFRKMRMPVWYSWPSLVDHRDAPSLLRHDRQEPRQAHRFEGPEWSALDSVWWEGQVLVMAGQHVGHRAPRKVTRARP